MSPNFPSLTSRLPLTPAHLFPHTCDSQSLVSGPGASEAPSNVREMQILRPHLRLNQKLLVVGREGGKLCLLNLPGNSDAHSSLRSTALY